MNILRGPCVCWDALRRCDRRWRTLCLFFTWCARGVGRGGGVTAGLLLAKGVCAWIPAGVPQRQVTDPSPGHWA